jgi:polysaccharide deacetylase family protein (PEP-CTERM system associated)
VPCVALPFRDLSDDLRSVNRPNGLQSVESAQRISTPPLRTPPVGAEDRSAKVFLVDAVWDSFPRTAMSIDVEDWFQVENLSGAIGRDTWNARHLRVERNMDRMLGLMAQNGVRSTCFVLGWIANRCPALIKRIAAEGHEIASHGYRHEMLDALTHEEFRADVERSKNLLEDLTGTQVIGYRAPAFSIKDWSIPILQDLGFTYDSSVFPTVAHDRYGRLQGMDASRPLIEVRPGFHEVCVSCVTVGSHGVPWGGGGYFRLLPYAVFRRGVSRILRAGQPYVFYIHPWEIDPDQPRVDGVARAYRFRHYVGLDTCERRFKSLLGDFRWSTVAELVAAWSRDPARGRT